MVFDKNRPYNDLPLLPPAADLETKTVLKQALSASRAMAELKVAGALIPNQAVLLTTLGLQETKLSSEIENIVTTNDELYRAFADGNGRTGRILNILYLVQAKLLEIPILYLSRFINQHRAAYYAGLRGVTENGTWQEWLLYMLKAVEETALETSQKIRAIHALIQSTAELVREQLPKVYCKELIQLIFHQPYIKIRFLEAAGLSRTRQNASSTLQALSEIGVLRGTKIGREWYYLNPSFLELLSQ